MKSGAPYHDILKAIDAALATCGKTRSDIGALASLSEKASEQGLIDAADALTIPIVKLNVAQLNAVADKSQTHSEMSISQKGVPSVAETAALAALAALEIDARLLAPRQKSATATCALATNDAVDREIATSQVHAK